MLVVLCVQVLVCVNSFNTHYGAPLCYGDIIDALNRRATNYKRAPNKKRAIKLKKVSCLDFRLLKMYKKELYETVFINTTERLK